jgi:hypothetical protein
VTVLIFAGKDSEGNAWPPDFSHETAAALDIIKRLWVAYGHLRTMVAVVTNLHCPSADVVILSERGIGVIELKHSYGRIIIGSDDVWYAGTHPIRAGGEGQGRRNPHDQVRDYAGSIRSKLMKPPNHTQWLPGRPIDWDTYRLSTAVCFTNPDAALEGLHAQLEAAPPTAGKDWELFTVLNPDGVTAWVGALRLEAMKGREADFEPYKLSPEKICEIARGPLWATEWPEAVAIMPTGEAFGLLVLLEGGRQTPFYSLDREEVVLGRDAGGRCAVVIPPQFTRTSRTHCRILRTAEGLFIEDLDSTNGTFLNGVRVKRRQKLVGGERITLGGPIAEERVCLLRLDFKEDFPFEALQTDGGSSG